MNVFDVIYETNFGGVYGKVSLADFKALGYDFGDSFDIEFSTGYRLDDVPYYNGYYTATGGALICGYQGYPYIDICFNSGEDLWVEAGLHEGDTVKVSLHEKGKYKTIQDTFSLCYSNRREDFASDEDFGNFRAIKGGLLKDNYLFRGASPVDNEYNRAGYVDALLQKNGIKYDINLSDCELNVREYQAEHTSVYFNELYDNGKVALLNMGAGFQSEKLAKQLAQGIRDMIANEGPFYIHCVEGKDRTGFIVAVLLGLADASYDEIVKDYMETYRCYYGITMESDPGRYMAIKEVKIDDYLSYIADVKDHDALRNASFVEGAKRYLRFGGMSEQDIVAIIAKIRK